MKILFLIGHIFLLIVTSSLYADPEDFDVTRHNGWHWYKDKSAEQKQKKIETEEEHKNRINKEYEVVQERINTAEKEMVLHPTEENVLRFIRLQQQIMERSFNDVPNTWKKVLLKHPEFNYSLVYSGNVAANKIRAERERKNEEEAIAALAKTSGLFFFYRSNCPYCRVFAPTVKLFAETYHINVVPITTDGIALPEFPKSFNDHGQARKFQVQMEPALFAVNPYTRKAFPIAYGLISFDELRKNILDAVNQMNGEVS
jgi:conjugal transfer pilus assembly protein TraF